MASNTESFFFKAENSNLTVEQIREAGYIAGETSTGFIETNLFYSRMNLMHHLEIQTFDYEKEKEVFLKFIINGLKPNTPPLMFYSSSSFGGCMDDYPELTVYLDHETTQTKQDTYGEDSPAEVFFKECYKVDTGCYNTVDFHRYTDDIITEKQKENLKQIQLDEDNRIFQKFVDSVKGKSVLELSLEGFESYERLTAVFGKPDYREREALELKVKHIKQYLEGMKE